MFKNDKTLGLKIVHRGVAFFFISLHLVNSILLLSGVYTKENKPPLWWVLLFVAGTLGCVYHVLFDFGFFRWNYSRIGAKQVPVQSDSDILWQEWSSSGGAGWCHFTSPFVLWTLRAEGFSMKLAPLSEVFIKWDEIDSIKGEKVFHHSEVVRSPISMPASVVKKVDEFREQD